LQSTRALQATENLALDSRQRFLPLTREVITRGMSNMTPRQLERWTVAAELSVRRLNLAHAPEQHRQIQNVAQRLKLEERAARRPTPRALLALAGVFIAVGVALPPTQAQARIVCFLLAAVALSPLLIPSALDWREDEADRLRPEPLPSFLAERARIRELESTLDRMEAGLPLA
jgi:hypothetical protein